VASALIYRKEHAGKEWDGDAKDLAEYGLDQMGWFNYNLPSMVVDASKIRQASPDEKKAFLYLMETYDRLGMSWASAGRFIKGATLDPTSYIGLGTFGLGSAAGHATKLASKVALREMLNQSILTGIEGAFQAGTQDAVRQDVEIETGGKTEFSGTELAKSMALGATIGGTLGAAGSAIGTIIRKKDAPWEKAVKEEAKAVTSPAEDSVTLKPRESSTERSVEQGAEPPSTEVIPGEAPQAEGHGPAINEDGSVNLKSGSGGTIEPNAERSADATAELQGPHSAPSAQSIIEAVREVSASSGGRVFPRTREAVAEASNQATELLMRVQPDQVYAAVEQLRREAVTVEERQILNNTFKNATDKLEAEARVTYARMMVETDQEAKELLFKELEQVKLVRDSVKLGDTALSSMDGRVLGDRVGSFNTGERRNVSEETYLAAKGVKWEEATPAQKAWAQSEYFADYDKWTQNVAQKREIHEANKAIQDAFDVGNIAEAMRKVEEKQSLTDMLVSNEKQAVGFAKQAGNVANKGIRYLNEFIISTVFSPATIVVNMIPSILKTAVYPALRYVGNGPVDYAAMRQMTTMYSVMWHQMGAAFNAAKASWAYERSLLSAEPNRLLEHEAMIGGLPGRVVRFFPRVLSASDEFFGQLNYRGYVVGEAMGKAVEDAHRLGKTGADLEAYVQKAVEEAQKHLFSDKIDAPYVIDFLRQKALERGKKGEAVEEWIKLQLDKNADLFKVALSQSGRNYADDLLFKRSFSGENFPSRMAAGYEKFVNDHPIMRLVGQMFFRTPVRVFEEGLRMTPVVQFAAPNFIDSVRGLKGQAAQARANTELLLSYAIASYAMLKYSKGELTSSGPTDYKERRGRENAGDYQPYSLRYGEHSLSVRNLDPFSTPFKIVANVLDRLQDLQYRKAQGDFVDKDYEQALGWMSVSVGAIGQALKDANLIEGVEQLWTSGEALFDPEKHGSFWQRFAGQKAQMIVPNVVSKAMMIGNLNMNDPVTVSQYLRSKINPADAKIPRQYDVLGQIRRIANPVGALIGVNITSDEELKRGRTEKELAVLKAISNLEIASGSNIGVAPTRVNDYGMKGIDLRTQYSTRYPDRTLYDRWMEFYAATPVVDMLYNIVVKGENLSVGTRDIDGLKVDAAKKIVKSYRDIALQQLAQEEIYMQSKQKKAWQDEFDAKTGRKDNSFLPYR